MHSVAPPAAAQSLESRPSGPAGSTLAIWKTPTLSPFEDKVPCQSRLWLFRMKLLVRVTAGPISMRRLCVLQTKVDVVESHILRTVGLDQARGSIADGMDCRRSNCFLATSVEQTAGGHCETELQFVPTVMDSGVPPPRFRCRHNRKPARSRLSAADLPPAATERKRRPTHPRLHRRRQSPRPEGPTHCILCVVIVDKCCPLGFL